MSSDPANYPDAPTEGIRRILRIVYNSLSSEESDKYDEELKRGQKIKTRKIGEETPPRSDELLTDRIHVIPEYIRLSTTVGTNALLERKGEKHGLVITKGFKVIQLSLFRLP